MLYVEVCVGSSCFLRGAPEVIERLKKLIEEKAPRQVEIKGTFCLEKCTHGVTVRIGGQVFSGVHLEDVDGLFETEVLSRIANEHRCS